MSKAGSHCKVIWGLREYPREGGSEFLYTWVYLYFFIVILQYIRI